MKHSDFDLTWHSMNRSDLVPPLAIANLSSAILALFNDQPVAALCTEVRPDPLHKDADPQAALCQKLYMDQGPDEPSQETAHHDTPALQHGKILADDGKVALVKVAKGRKR